ncbi:MAG: DUF5753 domain-containing protein [Streptosporangiaceae bacterium]
MAGRSPVCLSAPTRTCGEVTGQFEFPFRASLVVLTQRDDLRPRDPAVRIAVHSPVREDPPLLYVLLDEEVLHRPVAPPDVMSGQMEHLLEMSRRPNVTIQVVPHTAGGHSGLLGAFIVAEMGDAPGIVFLEDACDGRVAEDAAMVAQAMRNFDALRSEALTRGISRDLIEKIAKDKWT